MYRGEHFNGFSHLTEAILTVAGMAVLVTSSTLHRDMWRIVDSTVYGTTLVLLYTISMLYHSLRGPARSLFQRLGYRTICLMIIESYTPFTLITLCGPWGWVLFGISWILATIGIAQELQIDHRTHPFPLLAYVVMGWLVLAAMGPLTTTLPAPGLWWVITGGALHTVGITFFLFGKKVRHFHGIWYLFALAGNACQFVSILLYMG